MTPRRFLFYLATPLLVALTVFPIIAQDTTETPQPETTQAAPLEATPEATVEGLSNSIEGHAVITQTLPFDPQDLQRLHVPDGFKVNLFAQGLGNVRWMAYAPDGTLFVTRFEEGDVIALTDANSDGIADETHDNETQVNVAASDLPYVHGIAFKGNQVYLATDTKVYVADWSGGAVLGEPREIIGDLPTGGQHPRRTIAFGPDGLLYLTVGSDCNACGETNPEQATILQVQPDGSARTVFASGLRNTLGFGWSPVTGDLWGMDQGSDWRGDDQPPEELNQLEMDKNYGWPWCFADQQPDVWLSYDPPGGTGRAAYCQRTTAPALTYTAHSSPIGFVFYTADQFPADYQNDALIAMRGSWNRSPISGYKVVRLQFDDNGQPTGFEDFLTGFAIEEQLANFGRVAGLVVAPDGSLLVAEDTNGMIYRISYSGS